MKEIALTDGTPCLVDDDDFEFINQFNWTHQRGRSTSYAMRHAGGKTYGMHRLLAAASHGEVVDHIDGNGLNNQRSNLRLCSNSQNLMNGPAHSDSSTSSFRGVYFSKQRKKWMARICKDYEEIYIGIFETEEDAARAYDKKALELHGEFARLNFPKQ